MEGGSTVPKVTLYDMDGRQVGEIELSEKVFGAEVNEALLHQAVVMFHANQRQGTVATKTRSFVSGGGRKPWRQKGTGRARQGSTRAPQWRGGGTVFGPHPREYRQAMPKKMRQAALRSALSAKVAAGDMIVLSELTVPEPKTKIMANVISRFDATHFKGTHVATGTTANPASVHLPYREFGRPFRLCYH
jgi:large subunit ribosomal protein L4